MKLSWSPFVLLLALAAPSPASAAWVHETSDLAPDPAVTWGQLPNGLRYAILPHADPPGRASLRLYVDAGSLMEEGDQQGLAHFLEHMAFNGTKHYPPGKLIEYLQRLGMGFGSDTNAHTFFKETVYKLELPEVSPALVEEGFQVLRDYADGLLFVEQEVEDERGIILAEKRDRDSPDWRSFVDWLRFTLPDGLVSARLPIGTEECIQSAPRQRFLDFYQRWYTADRMVVVFVGDLKPDQVVPVLTKHFADLRRAEPPVPDPPLGTVNPRPGIVPRLYVDPELAETQVSLDVVRPAKAEPDGAATRARELRLRMANAMVSRRLEILAKREGAPITRASIHADELFDLDFADYGSIDASCDPAKWEAALAVIDQELRRALEHGFTDAELAEAKANFLEQIERQARSAATRKARDLADQLVSRIGERRVFTHPESDLERARPLLEAMTAAQCHAELVELWGDRSRVAVHASGNLSIPGGAPAVLAAYRKSLVVPVEPPDVATAAEFAYDVTGEPAGIQKRTRVADLDITQIVFDNEVRANFKPTDFEANKILVQVRLGSGLLTAPPDKPGLPVFASATFDDGGLEAHGVDELQRLLAGRSVSSRFQVGDDAFEFSGQTTPEDLLLQLQLLVASVTAPGYREEAERQFDKNLDPLYAQIRQTPEGVLRSEVDLLVHGGDVRFGYPAREVLEARSLAEVRDWLTPHLRTAYLEITLVGDFDLELAVDAVSRTFGSLPPRSATKPELAEARKVVFPAERQERRFEYPSELPKAMGVVYWPTADMSDIRRTRRLGLLSSIFRDRLRVKVREELGDAYSPYARNTASEAFTGYGNLFALVETSPEQAPKVLATIRDMAGQLVREGISADELDRARKPMLNMIAEYRRTNEYWMTSVMAMCQEQPQRLDWAREFVSDYEQITQAELDALAKTYLAPEAALPVLITPAPKAE
jgi:zinc protease